MASQNGFVDDRPQRHSATGRLPSSSHAFPSASTMRTGPVTLYGPLSRTLISTGGFSSTGRQTYKGDTMKPRMPSPSLVISIIALIAATSGTAIAAVSYARNAGKVDGKSAVASTATLKRAAGKLVATDRSGADRGKIPGKFVAGVMRGDSRPFGALIQVADNANGAPQPIAGAPGLGLLTVSCNDQAPRAGVEDPRLVIAFANGSGSTVNVGRRVGSEQDAVSLLQPGAADSFVIGGSEMFEYHVERNLHNLRVEGVVRQDGRGSGAAACLIYGFALEI